MSGDPYRGHRFPREIISYAVWFYYRFAVSFRDTEEAMASRGVLVSSSALSRNDPGMLAKSDPPKLAGPTLLRHGRTYCGQLHRYRVTDASTAIVMKLHSLPTPSLRLG